jgi:hypothetical protein
MVFEMGQSNSFETGFAVWSWLVLQFQRLEPNHEQA